MTLPLFCPPSHREIEQGRHPEPLIGVDTGAHESDVEPHRGKGGGKPDRFCIVARKDHPRLKGAISIDTYRTIGHVVASAVSERDSAKEVQVRNWLGGINIVAVVPLWLTALVMVSTTDVIATCPMRLAQRQAAILNLQILKQPFQPQQFDVFAVRRTDRQDAGIDWFLEQIKKAARPDAPRSGRKNRA